MIERQCNKCGEIKPFEDFGKQKDCRDGIRPCCKKCTREYQNKYHIDNKERLNKYSKEYRKNNPKRIREYHKQYCKNNKEKILEYVKIWAKNNPEKVKKTQARHKKNNIIKIKKRNKMWKRNNPEKIKESLRRRMLNPTFHLSKVISKAIWDSLKNGKNGKHWETLVDFTLQELMTHLEKQFKPGMSWENHNRYGWHIDHIRPISSFNFKSYKDPEFKKCWALDNLQPLWASENLIKGDVLLDNKFEIIREAGMMVKELKEIGVIEDE